MHKRKHTLLACLLALISGGMLALCFPEWDMSGLIWVWMLPLLPVIWKGKKKRYGFGIAYLAGLTFWLINLSWLWTVSGAGAIGMAVFLALYMGVWGALAVSLGNPWRKRDSSSSTSRNDTGIFVESWRSIRFASFVAAAWVGLEWLRGWIFTGFIWNGLGVSFYQTPVLAQAADLVGVTGLSFTPVFVSAILVQTGHRMMKQVHLGKVRPRLDFAVAVVLIILQFAYGVWRLHSIKSWDMQEVRVLLIQENTPQDVKWNPTESARIIQGYTEATQNAIDALEVEMENALKNNPGKSVSIQTPDIVVWPESSMQDPLMYAENAHAYYTSDAVYYMLSEEIKPLGNFTLIAGMNEMEATLEKSPDGDRVVPDLYRMYNSLVAIPPEYPIETNTQSYHKIHLVLFGEYIPFVEDFPILKKIFKMSSGLEYTGNFLAGSSTEPLKIPLRDGKIDVIPTVCYEDTVGRLTRHFVRPNKPQIIVNVTNDGWFLKSAISSQHMANAQFRAIELRRPLIRCANTGVSGIVSVTGSLNDPKTGKRQVVEDPKTGSHYTRGTLYGHAYAPTHGPLTLYAIAGDWFAWLMIVLVSINIIVSFIRKRTVK